MTDRIVLAHQHDHRSTVLVVEPVTLRPKHLLVAGAVLFLFSFWIYWFGWWERVPAFMGSWGILGLYAASALDAVALTWLGARAIRRRVLVRRAKV